MVENKKLALIILDGWGKGDGTKSDAIANANTPFYDSLLEDYPHSWLKTSGEDVGLPDGQMGNSEVGHLNIGAGRVVYQDLVRINRACKDGSLAVNPALREAFEYAKENDKAVHFMGLVSDGGVHSSQEHLHALCDIAKDNGLEKVFIHAFMDGRDTDPHGGKGYLQKLEAHLENSVGKIASVIGRYYAMDRDRRWERVREAYELLVKGKGRASTSVIEAIEASYTNGVTDEFIKPIIIIKEGKPIATIEEGDVVICFNFRTDRCREITIALTQTDMQEYGMKTMPLHYVTMARYDDTFKNVHVVFEKENLRNTIGEVLAKAGKTQVRIAETEKYPHVTFFFSGGREEPFENESRLLIPSPKVATYDMQPEMSAYQVKEAIVKDINTNQADFICLNFANPDMVGHTGVYEAIVKAVETTDECAKAVVKAGLAKGYSFIIIADHGNADFVINQDGSPNTAHTTNPVPCILIDADKKQIKDGRLADIAPTILNILGVAIPEEMTGEVLVN